MGNPYAGEKYSAAVHAPSHVPVHRPAPYVAPVVHKPVVHPAPAPYVAPIVHKPVVHPALAYHAAPAYGKEPSYDGPAVYEYGYAVHDDYAKTDFQANEHRDGYTTNGEYRVNLPDGRTQVVN